MNLFSDLYRPDKQGAWQSQRQGLHAGIDLHDWKQFVSRAVMVIETDPDPERRLHKAQRLHDKATRTAGNWCIEGFIRLRIGGLIVRAEEEIAHRGQLVQLQLWQEAQS